MQTRLSYPGSAYPTGRPPFFAMHYIARIFREGAIAQFRLKPIAVVMLVKIVTDEDRNWYQRPVSLFNMDLARDLDCSEDTVQRTRDELIKAGLLHYERHGDRRSGTYWVKVPPHWEDFPGPQRRPEHPTGRMAAEATAVGTAGGRAEATADQSFPKKNLFQPPPVPVPDPWTVVVERLRTAEVELATEAAKDAQRNGFTPELALACVDWFLRPDNRAAYGPGVLLHRFRRADASRLPPDQGWPPPNPQAALRQSRKQEAERAAEARREADARAAEKVARTKELTQKLLQWGDSIDRLTQEERVALVAEKGPAFVREVRRAVCWRENALIRGVLLDAFAARYASN